MSGIFVFGSINMDIVAFCKVHPAVGETVMGNRVEFFPGGKGANQAIAAAKGGGAVTMLGCVGQDAFGRELSEHLASCGVDTGSVEALEGVASGVALITVAESGRNNIVVVPGANAKARFTGAVPQGSIALAQFESPLEQVEAFFTAVVAGGGTTILNPSPWQAIPDGVLAATRILVVNEHEYAQFLGAPATADPAAIIKSADVALARVACCIVTLGSNGLVVMEKGKAALSLPGHAVDAIDSTGAGDCFTGWLAACLAKGDGIAAAAERANAAAAISVTREGAGPSVPSVKEVEALCASARAVRAQA